MKLPSVKKKEVDPNILFVCSQPFFEWRGSPIRVGFNLLALTEGGHRVLLLAPPHGQAREIEGVTIKRCLRIPGVKKLPIGPSAPKLVYDFIHFVQGCLLLAKHRKLDCIHCVEDSGLPGMLLAKFFSKPLVFEKHSDPGSYRKSGAWLKNLIMSAYALVERLVILHAEVVIATGDELVKQTQKIRPNVRAYSIPDIPSSLTQADSEKVDELRSELVEQDQVLATYVGSFAVYQGIDLLFSALPSALEQNSKLKVLIIGGSDSEIEQRKAAVATQGYSDRVHFAGFVDPELLPAYLKASDILLSPRISGINSPLKVLDYLKAQRCILATSVPANRQLLDESVCHFSEPDTEAFAHALGYLTQEDAYRERLAQKTANLLQTRYHFGYFSTQLQKAHRAASAAHSKELSKIQV